MHAEAAIDLGLQGAHATFTNLPLVVSCLSRPCDVYAMHTGRAGGPLEPPAEDPHLLRLLADTRRRRVEGVKAVVQELTIPGRVTRSSRAQA